MQEMLDDTELMDRTEDYRHGKLVIEAADYCSGMPQPPSLPYSFQSVLKYPTAD